MMDWKGVWSANSQYTTDDVVSYRGSSYISVAAAPPKGQPPPQSTADWNVVALGIFWRGVWTNTDYQAGEAVSYEGSSYITASAVPQGDPPPPQNLSKWNLLAAQGLMGITWRGPWDSNTSYSLNDGVTYEDGTYGSLIDNNQNHPPTDAKYWQNITKDSEADAMNIASLIISSVSALGALIAAIATGIMAYKNAVSSAIADATAAATAASTAATAASTAATAAQTAADTAGQTADTAKRAAEGAQQTADTAQQAADTAQRTADSAQQAAEKAGASAQQATEVGEAAQEQAQKTANFSNEQFNSLSKAINQLQQEVRSLANMMKPT